MGFDKWSREAITLHVNNAYYEWECRMQQSNEWRPMQGASLHLLICLENLGYQQIQNASLSISLFHAFICTITTIIHKLSGGIL